MRVLGCSERGKGGWLGYSCASRGVRKERGEREEVSERGRGQEPWVGGYGMWIIRSRLFVGRGGVGVWRMLWGT